LLFDRRRFEFGLESVGPALAFNTIDIRDIVFSEAGRLLGYQVLFSTLYRPAPIGLRREVVFRGGAIGRRLNARVVGPLHVVDATAFLA
jgi:hypothetical protein